MTGPAPTSSMTAHHRFWDRIARRYAKSPIKDEAAYEHKLALTRQYLSPSMKLLELGCGTGGTAVRHAPFVSQILATDVSENMIAIARERSARAGVDNVEFERAAVDEISGRDGQFDMVLALSLLHLVADRDAAIARIHALLKPGGLFVSNTACLAADFGWLRYLGPPGRALGLLPLVRLFTEEELIHSIRAKGFSIEEHWKPDGKSHYVNFVIARRKD